MADRVASGADWRVAPVLIVKEVKRSVDCYRDQLGFDVLGTFGDPLEMAFVGRGGIQIMLQDSEGLPTPGSNRNYKPIAWDMHVWVDDVDALHRDLVQRGARVLVEPHDTFYGTREIEVADVDDHVICFGKVKR